MVGAAVALVHLRGLRADREAEHLVAEADAEQRLAASRAAAGSPAPHIRRSPPDRPGRWRGTRRRARAPSPRRRSRWPAAPSPARRPRRGCGRCCASSRNRSRRHGAAPRPRARSVIALAQRPAPPSQPYICWQRDLLGEVHAFEPRPGPRLASSASMSNLPSARCAITALGAPPADPPGQRAGIDAGRGRSGRSPSASRRSSAPRGNCSAR